MELVDSMTDCALDARLKVHHRNRLGCDTCHICIIKLQFDVAGEEGNINVQNNETAMEDLTTLGWHRLMRWCPRQVRDVMSSAEVQSLAMTFVLGFYFRLEVSHFVFYTPLPPLNKLPFCVVCSEKTRNNKNIYLCYY